MEPRESRDEEFARLAAEYRQANADVIEAERQANAAANKAAAARTDRESLKKKLAGFVGANIRTRNAVVGGELVRVEWGTKPFGYDGTREAVEVSVEAVTTGAAADALAIPTAEETT